MMNVESNLNHIGITKNTVPQNVVSRQLIKELGQNILQTSKGCAEKLEFAALMDARQS